MNKKMDYLKKRLHTYRLGATGFYILMLICIVPSMFYYPLILFTLLTGFVGTSMLIDQRAMESRIRFEEFKQLYKKKK